MAEIHLKLAAPCHIQGVVKGLIKFLFAEACGHLFAGLEEKLVRGKLQAFGVLNGLAGLNAEKGIMGLRILPVQIVAVVRRHKRDGEFMTKLLE